MITSLRKIIESDGTKIENTIYRGEYSEVLDRNFSVGNFFEWTQQEPLHIWFKRTVTALGAEELKEVCPALVPMKDTNISYGPLFTAGLENYQEALDSHRQIGIFGGPCLFGVEEVLTTIVMKDGQKFVFDYCTGKKEHSEERNTSFKQDEDDEESLLEFMVENGPDISNVYFENRKQGVTIQEHMSIECLFEAAKYTGGRIVIPIPDMSYQKYLEEAAITLDDAIYHKVLMEFRDIAYQITDMYIDYIDQLSKKYPNVDYVIVHEREEHLLNTFYEKRAPFIERNRVLKTIGSSPQRIEAVKDYISMPALPYYIHGITDILQFDSLDETDTHRKCRKAHKGTINLSCILFPDLMSKDGVHTIYNSSLDYKEYIR